MPVRESPAVVELIHTYKPSRYDTYSMPND